MSILPHLYLRTSLHLPLAYYKSICCNVRREREDRIKITFWFIYECKRWLLMKTSEPRNQLFLVWSPRGTAAGGKKNPLLEMTLLRGVWFYSVFFFSPFRMLHNKLLLSVVLQSTCTWSTHQGTSPPLTLAAFDQQQREEGWFYCIFLPCICTYLYTVCVCIYAQCEWVCKCEYVREQEIVTDFETKAFWLWEI